CTARLLSTGALAPKGRSHKTILPAAFAGSRWPTKQSATRVAKGILSVGVGSVATPTELECTSGSIAVPAVSDAPEKVLPFPSSTVPPKKRSCVLAATVVIHGPGLATDAYWCSPRTLPPEAATNTPACAANMNATCT